ncbi:response regulator [Pseudoduganella aquatica]|uniref:Response regulator n=1 Tax=Pseudoduganella aquatica TaxID=2660641 RepID=A0A7X4KM02_9BURK|nr:response regulator [Pseudoduganella aquatica]MYN07300.1 response regulator [Pseudoduganella aquatica]
MGVLNSILYVEDNPHVRGVAKMALEVIGNFKVRECSSGLAALRLGADFHPDLILLDVQEPGMDGVATLAQLRSIPHLCHTPAMFVTGAVSAGEMARYVAAGAAGIIAKPLEPLRLAGQLRRLWDERPEQGLALLPV